MHACMLCVCVCVYVCVCVCTCMRVDCMITGWGCYACNDNGFMHMYAKCDKRCKVTRFCIVHLHKIKIIGTCAILRAVYAYLGFHMLSMCYMLYSLVHYYPNQLDSHYSFNPSLLVYRIQHRKTEACPYAFLPSHVQIQVFPIIRPHSFV